MMEQVLMVIDGKIDDGKIMMTKGINGAMA
jgi:hypothetical protein